MGLRRGGYWAAVAGAIAALVAGILLATHSEDTSGPDGVVRAYFAALSRGDAPTALALGAAPSGTHAFLTSDVLRLQQRLAPLRDVAITSVTGTGELRTVTYSYVLRFPDQPRAVTGEVGVDRHGGMWRLASVAVPVQLGLDAATSRATLAGAAVPDGIVAVFPGAVPVRFDTSSLQVDDGSVTFGDPTELALHVAVSAAGRKAVGSALAAAMHTCFPRGGPSAPQCPLPDDPRVVPGSLRGSIDTSGLHKLHYAVESLASGTIRVDGTLAFDGGYERLDDDNIARARTGELVLRVAATTPSVGPARLRFTAEQS